MTEKNNLGKSSKIIFGDSMVDNRKYPEILKDEIIKETRNELSYVKRIIGDSMIYKEYEKSKLEIIDKTKDDLLGFKKNIGDSIIDNRKYLEILDNIGFKTIFDNKSDDPEFIKVYENEINIRKTYGTLIKHLIEKYCIGSLIDEDLLYSIIAKESKFDINAKSYTGVRGLCQITGETTKSTLRSNKRNLKEKPEFKELYITNIKSRKEQLKPINQIKLAIAHLLELEKVFVDIKDENFKKTLIIASYNLGTQEIEKILRKKPKLVNNWKDLKYALINSSKKGNISKGKLIEVISYVNDVKEYMTKT